MAPQAPDGREFYRTSAKVLVRYGPENHQARQMLALDGESWQVRAELEAAARQALENLKPSESLGSLMDVLRWIDFKLDLVLFHLTAPQLSRSFPSQTTTVDISGSGLALAGGEDLEPGQRIMLCLNLPDAPGRPIFAVGEVVRQESGGREHEPGRVAVQFVEISEDDRERIIRYSFRRQRQELARRSEEGNP